MEATCESVICDMFTARKFSQTKFWLKGRLLFVSFILISVRKEAITCMDSESGRRHDELAVLKADGSCRVVSIWGRRSRNEGPCMLMIRVPKTVFG